MKPITTEEIILVPCLFVGWAIATIARDVAAPLAALVLTLLGWRPPSGHRQAADDCSDPLTWEQIKAMTESARSQLATLEPRRFPPLPALMPPHIAITYQPRTFSSRDALQPLVLSQLRSMARLRGLDPAGLSKAKLIEALLDNAVDRANDYSAEVPTAAERSPSLRRRRP